MSACPCAFRCRVVFQVSQDARRVPVTLCAPRRACVRAAASAPAPPAPRMRGAAGAHGRAGRGRGRPGAGAVRAAGRIAAACCMRQSIAVGRDRAAAGARARPRASGAGPPPSGEPGVSRGGPRPGVVVRRLVWICEIKMWITHHSRHITRWPLLSTRTVETRPRPLCARARPRRGGGRPTLRTPPPQHARVRPLRTRGPAGTRERQPPTLPRSANPNLPCAPTAQPSRSAPRERGGGGGGSAARGRRKRTAY